MSRLLKGSIDCLIKALHALYAVITAAWTAEPPKVCSESQEGHLAARMRNMTKKRAMAIRTAMITFLISPNMSGNSTFGIESPRPAIVSPQPLPSVGLRSTGSLFGSS